MNLGFNIARSLIEGNRNQHGHHAWGQLLWELYHTAVQSVNKSFCYYNMKEKLRRDIKRLSQSKDPSATTELMEVSTNYDEYMGVLGEIGAEAIKQGESSYPEYIHAEMYNNTYHVHYKYISSDINKTELGQIQEEAYAVVDPVLGGDYPDLEKAVCRHDAWVFPRTLQQYNNSNSWPSCPAVVKTQKCRVPNESHTPDMVIAFQPEDRSQSL